MLFPKLHRQAKKSQCLQPQYQGKGAPKIVTVCPRLCQDSEMEIEAEGMRNM